MDTITSDHDRKTRAAIHIASERINNFRMRQNSFTDSQTTTTPRNPQLPVTSSRRRDQSKRFFTFVAAFAAMILFPAFRQQLDYATFYCRSTMELLIDYPLPLTSLHHVHDPSARELPLNSSLRKRPRLDRSTFFHTGASEEDIRKFFHWDPSSILDETMTSSSNTKLLVEPMWSCHNPDSRSTRLIFHHMPKSGGLTYRALLKAYSLLCNASIALVSHCTFLGREYMDGSDNATHWRNGIRTRDASKNCVLSNALDRTGQVLTNDLRMSTSLLNEHQFDILAGHLPLGSDEFWKDSNTGKHVNARSLVLFRNPLEKYVSQFLADHWSTGIGNSSIDEVVAFMAANVQNRTSRNEYYELYSRTLIRPEQRTWIDLEHVQWTPEHRLNLTLRNLVESKTVVGIMERVESSIELVRYLLDKNHEIPHMAFSYFSSNKLSNKIALLHGASSNRTKDIVARIEQNSRILAVFNEFLKYEQAAYDWAVRIHERQVRIMQQSYLARNMSSVLPA
ncbi:hypothetical protein MPSEU_000274600 [Mayamaea pseudoterrestris]|nr:hypothetical protein MPSEU_000274600 [Mayamaea pseudoterrestris]